MLEAAEAGLSPFPLWDPWVLLNLGCCDRCGGSLEQQAVLAGEADSAGVERAPGVQGSREQSHREDGGVS